MTKRFLVAALSAVVLAVALFANPGQSSASFHLMRIDAAMGGLNGDANVQYVELRSANAFQNLLNTHVICFFDATGAPYARFTFSGSNPSNGADGASYLVGTTSFDAAWAAGAPDYTFSPSNTTAIAGGADVDHPMRSPGGKIAFGSDFQNTPSLMCQANFTLVDSIVYGSDGLPDPTVDYGTKFATDLPTNSTTGLHLQGPVCIEGSAHLCPPSGPPLNGTPRDNSVNYAIDDLNAGANQPRNSLNQQGPLSSDVDGDGVPNATDLCPGTAAAAPVDANGCSDAQVDPDADAICSPGAPSSGPSGCTGSDNCPNAANNNQADGDADGVGNVCDNCPNAANADQADGDADGVGNVCDNCPVWANPSQAALPWPIPAGDADCDGFPDTVNAGGKARETYIGTDPLKHCAATPAANDEGTPDAMPPDFNDDRIFNGQDTGKFGGPFGSFNHTVAQGPFGPAGNQLPGERFDFNGDGIINGQDTGKYQSYFNKACTP